jgi:hypothetical protein
MVMQTEQHPVGVGTISGAFPAGENHIGSLTGAGNVVEVALTLDTAAYASGDLLVDSTAFVGARVADGHAVLQSLLLIDEDDQKMAMTIYFVSANADFGTVNSAPSIADAAARDILGFVDIGVGDYKDLGGVSVACIKGIGLELEAGTGVTTVWVALVNGTGAPTYTAAGLRLRLGLLFVD